MQADLFIYPRACPIAPHRYLYSCSNPLHGGQRPNMRDLTRHHTSRNPSRLNKQYATPLKVSTATPNHQEPRRSRAGTKKERGGPRA